jgi:dephospho-CoA kinase
MYKVGITGSYFSGLNEVVEEYKKINIPIFDADLIFRFLIYNNSETIEKIQKEFGKSVFVKNQLDIYSFEQEKFRKLLDLVELDILKSYEKWRLKQKSDFTIFKSEILFEAGWHERMNFNINVFKPNGVRINQIQAQFKMKPTDVFKMLEPEMDVFQKNRLSQYVIHNYTTYPENIKSQINMVNSSLQKKFDLTIYD